MKFRVIGILVADPTTSDTLPEPNGNTEALSQSNINEAVQFTTAEIETLTKFVGKSTPFAVLIIPTRLVLARGDIPAATIRRQLVQGLHARGMTIIDPTDQLRAGYSAVHFPRNGYWTRQGQRIAADQLAAWLR